MFRLGRAPGPPAMGAVLNDFDDPAVRLHVDPNTIAGTMSLKTTLLLTSFSAAALGLRAADFDAAKLPPASTQAGVTYEKDIKPLFERSCFKCHGAEKQKGKLRLDSLEATLKGGSNGPGFEKGASAKSTFVASVARLMSEDENMPPEGKGKPFSKEEVGLLRAWIDQGTK